MFLEILCGRCGMGRLYGTSQVVERTCASGHGRSKTNLCSARFGHRGSARFAEISPGIKSEISRVYIAYKS